MARNAVGLVFLLIFMSAFILAGMGLSQTMIDQGRTSVNGTGMADEFETGVLVTQQGFNFVSYMPWIVSLAIVIVIFLGLIGLGAGLNKS